MVQLASTSEAARAAQTGAEALAPVLHTLAADDPGHRRRLHALRADAGYAAAWEDPDPLVTISIPTRSRPRLLVERSLASVLAQTHEHLEVLVIGDAAGPEIAAAVESAGDPRVRFANLTHQFVRDDGEHWLTAATLTRNEAYRSARGRWLLDMDDDDALRPEAVADLLAHARAERLEVAYGVLEAHEPDGGSVLVGGFPPALGHFGWQGAVVHAGLRFFEREHVASDLGSAGRLVPGPPDAPRGRAHRPSGAGDLRHLPLATLGCGRLGRPTIVRPMPPHRPLPKTPHFPALEQEVLERWRERDVFRESVRRREGAEPWVFYEGPPTANGRPGSHHVLARVFKDIFPRYQTMRGRFVERKGGWDCHGLPVEIAVEQRLGFTSKDDIERYGIAEFNQQCRESVFEFLEDWTALTERIGYWVDLEHPYRTLDPDYIESVWWALKTMWEKDLLFEGHKVVPYCVRCGTALSSHEVAQGYEDVEDPSDLREVPRDARRPARCATATCCWCGRRRRGRCVSNAAVAVDARPHLCAHRGGLRARRGARRARARRGRAGRRALPGARHARHGLRAAVRTSSARRSAGRRATPCCPATS